MFSLMIALEYFILSSLQSEDFVTLETEGQSRFIKCRKNIVSKQLRISQYTSFFPFLKENTLDCNRCIPIKRISSLQYEDFVTMETEEQSRFIRSRRDIVSKQFSISHYTFVFFFLFSFFGREYTGFQQVYSN